MHKGIDKILRRVILAVPVVAFFCPNSALAAGGLLVNITSDCETKGNCQLSDFLVVGVNVTNVILGISGSIILVMFVYGGFLWLISAGNSSRVEQGKKVLSSSLIGLIIVFGAYSLIGLLLAAFGITDIATYFKTPFGGK
jgi:Type IV secretion system pilin